MATRIVNSRIIKPLYEGNNKSPPTNHSIPLSVFDKATYDIHVSVLFAFRPPIPPNETLELGFQKALALYRPWAGRFSEDEEENPIILLNDMGVKFIEAYVDAPIDDTVSFEPSPLLRNFHPTIQSADEIVQVPLTRFSCGSLLVGFSAHHFIADGQSVSTFLVSWGQATRGIDISSSSSLCRPLFTPREAPLFDQFEHRGVEYITKELKNSNTSSSIVNQEEIVVVKVQFPKEFLVKLKTEASVSQNCSTFENLLAHLWRTITKARRLNEDDTTQVKITVNGRMRMTPNIPNYFGNLVLWAFPMSKVKDLTGQHLSYAAKVIHDSVAKINDDYFKSFIDFTSYKVKEEDLTPMADATNPSFCPNISVNSWLRFQFYDLDFGTGCPFAFMPSYIPMEGLIFILPISPQDGSIDVFVCLFKDNLDIFKQICYSL